MVEGMLYLVTSDSSLCIVPPREDRHRLLQEAHEGKFGGYLGDVKVFGTLARHYWRPKMQGDISSWCRACIVCATLHVGLAIKPLLAPIPVAGPLDRVGVDVLQLPVSKKRNKYARVFMDYLTKWSEVFLAKDQSVYIIAKLLVEQIITRHEVPTELFGTEELAFQVTTRGVLCDGYLQIKHYSLPPTDGWSSGTVQPYTSCFVVQDSGIWRMRSG